MQLVLLATKRLVGLLGCWAVGVGSNIGSGSWIAGIASIADAVVVVVVVANCWHSPSHSYGDWFWVLIHTHVCVRAFC